MRPPAFTRLFSLYKIGQKSTQFLILNYKLRWKKKKRKDEMLSGVWEPPTRWRIFDFFLTTKIHRKWEKWTICLPNYRSEKLANLKTNYGYKASFWTAWVISIYSKISFVRCRGTTERNQVYSIGSKRPSETIHSWPEKITCSIICC